MKQSVPADTGPSGKRATLADWCALHRITPEQCIGWMSPKPAQTTEDALMPTTDIPADQIWELCAQSLSQAMPDHRDDIDRAVGRIDVNTAPDRKKYPTAFTLHDSGAGRPYVSAHYGGTARDVLTLAHEFGHAIQILQTDADFTPPVAREVCAFLSEQWFIAHVSSFDPVLGAHVSLPWRRSVNADFGARRDALLRACAAPLTPYDYAWNYPLARRLALAAATTLDASDRWSLFTGHIDVTTLACKINL